jgi:ArsR family transcriptional regulator, arsenate/arsenite/antimonite-responsive transcriptional repressor
MSPQLSDGRSTRDTLLADQLKALAHQARLAIQRVLARRRRCVCGEVVEVMPLAQATVSQHLKVLKQAGLIRGEIEGRKSCYCLDQAGIAELREALEAVRRDAELLVGCVAGAMDKDAYLEVIKAAGFGAIRVAEARRLRLPAELTARCGDAGLESVTVVATKPVACCDPGCCS